MRESRQQPIIIRMSNKTTAPIVRRRRTMYATPFSWLVWLPNIILIVGSLIISQPSVVTATTLSCDPTSQSFGTHLCARKVRPGSVCDPILRLCTNPFARGCLVSSRANNTTTTTGTTTEPEKGEPAILQLRMCNSNDDNDNLDKNQPKQCQRLPYPFNYTEIRIHAGTTDSSLAMAWIYQIVLSELYQVPVTLVGKDIPEDNRALSFYAPTALFMDNEPTTNQYYYTMHADQPYDWDALEMTNLVADGDCRHADPFRLPCAHVLSQIWMEEERWDRAVRDKTIATTADDNNNNVMMGTTGLYIPAHTAQAYPELVSHWGLRDAMPQQLARIFRQPYTWGYYCQMIASNFCNGNGDAIAIRAPKTSEEAFRYYEPGLFTGYFGAANENNNSDNSSSSSSVLSNDNRMGHLFVPSSCDDFAKNNVEAQLYWNNITSLISQGPLLPNRGYELEHIRQIYLAANATRSHVMIWWYSPDSLVEMFRGTDYEMIRVGFPDFTQACGEMPLDTEALCSPRLEERLGSEQGGACGTPPLPLRQAIALSVHEQYQKAEAENELVHQQKQSPAWDVLRNIQVTDLDMRAILSKWDSSVSDLQLDGYDSYQVRAAVCDWASENIEDLQRAVPWYVPHTVKPMSDFDHPYLIAAQVIAALVALLVLSAIIAVVYWRRRLVLVHAQRHFVFQILLGLWLLTMAANLIAKEPSDTRCLLSQWLMTLGFTFAIVPIVVKVTTITYIAVTLRKGRDQYITISPVKMFLVEIAIVLLAIMYLMVWTALDPPSRVETETLEDGSFETTISCSSGSDGWIVASGSCQVVLLSVSTVLSILLWRVINDFKETNALFWMIVGQDTLLVARGVAFFAAVNNADYYSVLSYLLSVGSFFILSTYFLPMILRLQRGGFDEEVVLFYQNNRGYPAAGVESRLSNEPGPLHGDSGQSTLGLESAGSANISALIQAHMTVTRQRQSSCAVDGDDGEDGPITASCSHSVGAAGTQ